MNMIKKIVILFTLSIFLLSACSSGTRAATQKTVIELTNVPVCTQTQLTKIEKWISDKESRSILSLNIITDTPNLSMDNFEVALLRYEERNAIERYSSETYMIEGVKQETTDPNEYVLFITRPVLNREKEAFFLGINNWSCKTDISNFLFK